MSENVDEVVKTVKDVDKLFAQIVVNGETHKSTRYAVQQSATQANVRRQSNSSGEPTQGEDVYALLLNRILHNFSDQRVAQALQDEIINRQDADTALGESLTQAITQAVQGEASARQTADTALQGDINSEVTARTNADTALQQAIQTEASDRASAIAGIQSGITAETTARQNADTALQGDITSLGNQLTAETTARQNADTALQTAVNNEATARANADTLMQGDIATIQSKIPAQASSSNKLADKDFVNSSIATNTANFLGTYTSLADIEAIQNPTNNDYAFLQTTDSAGNTVYKRYKYSSSDSEWLFEYDLNNSSFTSEQWATINSGLTQQSVANDISSAVSDEATARDTAISNAIADEVTARNSAISTAVGNEATARDTAITNAVEALDVASVGGAGKYIESISEVDGKISAVEKTLPTVNPVDTVQSGNMNPVTSNAVAGAIAGLDVASVGGAGKYIQSISETDGKISAVEATMPSISPVDVVQSGNMNPITSNAVAGVKSTADSANSTATTAYNTANTANNTANTANYNASVAQNTANTANYNASVAQNTANTALGNANSAHSLASAIQANFRAFTVSPDSFGRIVFSPRNFGFPVPSGSTGYRKTVFLFLCCNVYSPSTEFWALFRLRYTYNYLGGFSCTVTVANLLGESSLQINSSTTTDVGYDTPYFTDSHTWSAIALVAP